VHITTAGRKEPVAVDRYPASQGAIMAPMYPPTSVKPPAVAEYDAPMISTGIDKIIGAILPMRNPYTITDIHSAAPVTVPVKYSAITARIDVAQMNGFLTFSRSEIIGVMKLPGIMNHDIIDVISPAVVGSAPFSSSIVERKLSSPICGASRNKHVSITIHMCLFLSTAEIDFLKGTP
jgi:hypothetical protein